MNCLYQISKSLPIKRVKTNGESEKGQKMFTFTSGALGAEFAI